jgi:uncharacterized protein
MTTTSRPPRFVDALTMPLDPSALDAADVIDGEPAVAATAFATIGDCEVGVWEHTPGMSRDVEVDEVFLVLSGRGSVVFDGGETVDLVAGRLVRLQAGERTTWTVHEPLRKVYVAG